MVTRLLLSCFVKALIVVLILQGCAQYRPQSAGFNDLLVQAYQLDTGDVVRLTVFDQDNITGSYTVDTTGHITVPLIGQVVARGLSVERLDEKVTARLKSSVLRDPDVTIEIAQYRPFFIMGEVTSAGQYSYIPNMTVETAIAIAGGFTPRAVKTKADISRKMDGKIYTSTVPMNTPLRPGDTVNVRERWF
jgi:polysaccharide export outer membrane protein